MIFRAEMLAKVLSGEKTVTRRRTGPYKMSRTYTVQPGRGKFHVAHIKVLHIRGHRLGFIDKDEAQREGFSDSPKFRDYWESLHGEWNPAEIVIRIRFELAPRCPDCAEVPA